LGPAQKGPSGSTFRRLGGPSAKSASLGENTSFTIKWPQKWKFDAGTPCICNLGDPIHPSGSRTQKTPRKCLRNGPPAGASNCSLSIFATPPGGKWCFFEHARWAIAQNCVPQKHYKTRVKMQPPHFLQHVSSENGFFET
jgi:hypothetical protein